MKYECTFVTEVVTDQVRMLIFEWSLVAVTDKTRDVELRFVRRQKGESTERGAVCLQINVMPLKNC